MSDYLYSKELPIKRIWQKHRNFDRLFKMSYMIPIDFVNFIFTHKTSFHISLLWQSLWLCFYIHTWRYCLWVWIEYFTEIKSSEWTDEIWIQLFETKLSRYLHIKFMPTCLLERCYVCIYISSRLNNLRITSKKRDFILCFAVYPTLLHKSIVVIE